MGRVSGQVEIDGFRRSLETVGVETAETVSPARRSALSPAPWRLEVGGWSVVVAVVGLMVKVGVVL